jgi:pyrroloquinoline quinone biosynthesis protein E
MNQVICALAPVGLLAELTHRCPLQCPYCSNPLALEGAEMELTTTEWLHILDQAATMGVLQLHLSGGEPLLRTDLEEIVNRAALRGLYTNLITSAQNLTRERLTSLVNRGLDHVQISFQDADAANADRIGGAKRGHAQKLAAARLVRELGLPLTVNAPVHRQNIDNLPAIIAMAEDLDAERIEVAHVQYYGWALKNRMALLPTREQVLKSLALVEAERERLKGRIQIDFVAPDYYAKRPKPCMGGWGRGSMNITPTGKVLPCHAAETLPGLSFENVRDRPLRDIWLTSSAFQKYRGTEWMKEPCRSCELQEVDWGGCRCQAFALAGDAREADPVCAKSPRNAAIRALAETEAAQPPGAFVYRNLRESRRLSGAPDVAPAIVAQE